LLRSLKDTIVITINGVEYIPKAKMMSLVVVFALVFVYNKLVDILPKHQLFYAVGGAYFSIFSIIAYYLADPEMGLKNTNASGSRLLGWISYCAIESFGSIGVRLFWAFVNSTISLEGAKAAYGLIIAGAQIGSVMGPTVATLAPKIGVATCYWCGSLCMCMMVISIYFYTQKFGVMEADVAKPKKGGKSKPGVMEGLTLFMKHGYIRGIFALSCLFMVEVTILDYTLKMLAKEYFAQKFPGQPELVTDHFAAFMGLFGQITNSISFLFSLTGTSFVIRTIGLRKTLLAFPSLCLCAILVVLMFPSLWVVFGAMMFLKAASYSLNNPCKEILYQPTSTAVKFKSKSWIDIFGARGSKAAGSVVTNALSYSVVDLVNYGSIFAIAVSSFLIWVATYMGRKFDDYTAIGYKVGEEPETEEVTEEEVPMTNQDDDTSCGILEEGQSEEK